jgi:ankyrin repeat protein
LNFEFRDTPRREVVIYRGVELSEAALEGYRGSVGKSFGWAMFSSFTEEREVAEEYGRAWRGGVSVLFELRSAWCRRLRNGTYLLHPFAVLQVEAVAGNVVQLVEVEGLGPRFVSPFPAQRPTVVMDGGMTELHAAGRDGDIRAIARFASRPEFLKARDDKGVTPLHFAAFYGQTEAVKALVWFGAEVNRPRNDGATPVCIAAQEGNESMVTVLASLGADINAATHDGCTPIYIAAQLGHDSTILTLVSLGADVNAAANGGYTPVYVASRLGHNSTVLLLVSVGANVNAPDDRGVTPLMMASAYGWVDVVADLLKAGPRRRPGCAAG